MNKYIKILVNVILILFPILDFLHSQLYRKLELENTTWGTKVTPILLFSLPVSAFYFLSQKNRYSKIFGGLVCLYMLYVGYDFLKQTSGAL